MQETLHMHPPPENNSLTESDNGSEVKVTVEGESDCKSTEAKEGREMTNNTWSLLKNWPLMSSVIVYCIFSLHDMAYSEVNKLTFCIYIYIYISS